MMVFLTISLSARDPLAQRIGHTDPSGIGRADRTAASAT